MQEIGRDGCVVVYADWCPHCKDMIPSLIRLQEELAERRLPASRLQCYNMGDESEYSKDEQAIISQTFHVEAFPSIMFVRNSEINPHDGPRAYDALRELVFGRST